MVVRGWDSAVWIQVSIQSSKDMAGYRDYRNGTNLLKPRKSGGRLAPSGSREKARTNHRLTWVARPFSGLPRLFLVWVLFGCFTCFFGLASFLFSFLFLCVCVCVCVCVRSDRMPCHQSFLRQQGVAAGPRVCHHRRHSRDPGEAVGDVQLCTCNGCAKSFWPVVSLAVCASC